MSCPYDSVPAGKKPEYNIKKGKWELVDLKEESFEDLKIIYIESQAEIKSLKDKIKELEKTISKLKKAK